MCQPVTAAFLFLCCASVFAAEPKPDLVLSGVLTHRDHQTYREVPFQVPPGVTRLTIQFSYSGREQHTTVDLGLFDQERFRGWSGGNKNTFTLSNTDATPSYLPGPIRPGTWKLILGIPNIRAGVSSRFEANVYFSHIPAPTPINTESGWYRGDLHMHTAHSDGSCNNQSGRSVPCPVFKTVEAAVSRGLDFIAITDHNTISHYDAIRELAPFFDRLLFISGREITTFQGHANVFGTEQFVDFRLTSPHVPTLTTLLDQVQSLHALISVNHPADPSGEACMGCGWTVPDTDFSRIQAIEAVNGSDSDKPISGIPFWQAQLNKGLRLTAIGGSDNHHAAATNATSGIGTPTTVVYAANLSEQAILDGIRSGRVFVDVEGTRNRFLDLTAEFNNSTVHMGDRLSAPKGAAIQFSVHTLAVHGAVLELIEDGVPAPLLSDLSIMQDDDTKTFEFPSDGSRHWLHANVRSATGQLLLLGNPIYLN